jgi:hypothetical protein
VPEVYLKMEKLQLLNKKKNVPKKRPYCTFSCFKSGFYKVFK